MSRTIRTTTRTAAALIGFGLVLTTAGCANPLDQLVNSVTEGALKEATGLEDISIPTDASGTTKLPSDWPDVPTPQQDPVLTLKTPDGMHATFQVSEEEFDALITEFEALGWAAEGEFNMSDQMRSHTFNQGDMVASLTGIADDTTGGFNLQYIIVTRASE